jgi:hypothetical protein
MSNSVQEPQARKDTDSIVCYGSRRKGLRAKHKVHDDCDTPAFTWTTILQTEMYSDE